MKKLNINDIRKLKPCYEPTKYVDENWVGTVIDILKMDEVPYDDRLWVATKFIDDKTNRLFAVWCAREALKLVDNPDQRSINACDVAERFANGKATEDELAAARDSSRDAARAAAKTAAKTAAWDSSRAAARERQIKHFIDMLSTE